MLFARKARFLRAIALVLALLLVAGCGGGSQSGAPSTPANPGSAPAAQPGASAGGDEIVIGTLWPLSGTAASWGTDNLDGAKIAVDLINEQGGVNGKKVRLINADNASNPTTAANEANRLITKEGVKVIVGTVVSSAALPASEVAEKNKVIYWEADAVTDDLTNRKFKYVFRVNERASHHGEGAVQFVREVVAPKLGVDPKQLKIAITHEDSAFGTSVSDAAERALKAAGMTVTTRDAYSAKATDLSSLVLKLKNLKVDVVINTGYTPDAILFWKQAKQLDLNLKALVGGGGWALVATGDGLGSLVNGVFDASGPVGINPAGLPADVRKLHDEFVKRWNSTHKLAPSLSSYQGFTAMWVLLKEVLPKAGSMDPEKIREAAMSLDIPRFGTVIGWGVKFDETGQNTRSFATVMQWQDNRVYTVWPKELAAREPAMIPLPTWAERK